MKFLSLMSFAGLLPCLFLVAQLSAQGDPAANATEQERAAHLEKMRSIAQSIHVYELSEKQPTRVGLIEQPVLKYSDDTRKLHESTMWVWGAEGRPSAIIAVEHYPQKPTEPKWLYEIVSLSTGRIAVERTPELNWKAREAGLQLKVLEKAPAPSDKAATRLRQMRDLQARFTAHERAAVGGRIQLKPLSRPLHRYQSPVSGVLDGAVFAFANGTNPEVLWIIEARAVGKAPPTWHFALAQMTGAEVFVNLDQKQIWECREADPPAERGAYINGWMGAATVDTNR